MTGIRVVIATPHTRHDALEKNIREHMGIEVLRVRTPAELDSSILVDFEPRFIFSPIGHGRFLRTSLKGLSV